MTKLANHPSMATGKYIGAAKDTHGKPLDGQRALIMSGPGENFRAQFNELATGYAFGWHEFPAVSFEVDDAIDASLPPNDANRVSHDLGLGHDAALKTPPDAIDFAVAQQFKTITGRELTEADKNSPAAPTLRRASVGYNEDDYDYDEDGYDDDSWVDEDDYDEDDV